MKKKDILYYVKMRTIKIEWQPPKRKKEEKQIGKEENVEIGKH